MTGLGNIQNVLRRAFRNEKRYIDYTYIYIHKFKMMSLLIYVAFYKKNLADLSEAVEINRKVIRSTDL